MLKKICAILILTCFTSACANQAMILSEPSGARVSIDGRTIGVTPCSYDYANSSGGSFAVIVEKPGYEAIDYQIQADETDTSARNSWLAAGLVWSPLWLGAFFTKKLKDSYNFVMKKVQPQFTAQAQPESEPRKF